MISKKRARKILGVSEKANISEIKKSYWLLAMKFHPDKNPGDEESKKKFCNISNAYEILTKNKTNNITEENNGKIGEYNFNDWGYFCWWKDNYF